MEEAWIKWLKSSLTEESAPEYANQIEIINLKHQLKISNEDRDHFKELVAGHKTTNINENIDENQQAGFKVITHLELKQQLSDLSNSYKSLEEKYFRSIEHLEQTIKSNRDLKQKNELLQNDLAQCKKLCDELKSHNQEKTGIISKLKERISEIESYEEAFATILNLIPNVTKLIMKDILIGKTDGSLSSQYQKAHAKNYVLEFMKKANDEEHANQTSN